MEDLVTMIENKDPVDIIYLDFRKAFDTVPHVSYAIRRNLVEQMQPNSFYPRYMVSRI